MILEMAEDKFAPLRQQAEDILRGRPANLADLSAADIQALIHNLQVHQLELELQNEELRRAHLDLQAARDRYADLYNFAPVGYFTLDANGAIVEANLTGAALLNVARSALIGAPLTRFVAPEDRAKYAVYRVQLGQSQEPQRVEIKLVRQADAPFHAQLEGVAAYDQAGRFTQSRIAVSDVSERVRAEEVLLQASRLEVATTLAGGIAHDINNLMTAVLGNAELLNLNLNRPDAPDMLAAICRSARRASELAQQMLAFARGGKYEPGLIDLNDSIQQALQLQLPAIPDKLIVEQQLASELWPVTADASQMGQVIINLLTNAVEAGDGQGRIRVSTANLMIDEPWARSHPVEGVCDLKPGRYVSLAVEDTGGGMSTEVLARVFEPFFTTKFQGRGMGLAAVYGIVQNHGGDISIESEAGHGTVVKVYFPAVESES
jgi:two-component system cell cycle sensor histidine kinase/response regulator CckA